MNLNNKVKDKTVDQSMEIFYNELSNAYNRSFPYVRLSRKRAKDKPWVTTCLKRSINEKHKLFKKYLINRTPENEANYRNYSNKLRTIIRKAEINYYRKIFDQKENSIKILWKHLGSFLNSPRENTKVHIDKLLVDGKELTNKKDIADSLNNYFINIGTQLSTKVNASDKTFHHYLKEPTENTIFLRPTNSYELLKELNSINNKQEPYGHLTSASAIIERFSMAYVGKLLRESNRISSQLYAIVTTCFFHFKWKKFLNLRISFQIVRGGHPRNPMI